MTDCTGKIDLMEKRPGSVEKVEGVELQCQSREPMRFTGGSRSENLKNAKRFVNRNGFKAVIKDKTN